MRVHFLQHVTPEGPEVLSRWATSRGHTLSGTKLYDGETLPPLDTFDLLVVFGGPMNVYQFDKHPWLRDETAFIREAIKIGKGALGLCLGAQLIAAASGGKVSRNAQVEIGWFPVELSKAGTRENSQLSFLPQKFEALHWHGDTFSVPPNATHLARSEACENQAFSLGERVLGLQFHFEFTQDTARVLAQLDDEPWPHGNYVQPLEEILSPPQRFQKSIALMFALLDRMENSCRTPAPRR